MKVIRRGGQGIDGTRALLRHLLELPDLASTLQALSPPAFAALIRNVGVEDSGELVALATTEQLVQAFDEDLFVSERVGERESLDVGRFVTWLEVLREAGDHVAAARVAELDEDFVAHALSAIFFVLEDDALRERLDDTDEDEATQVDKALESALTEELDGYLLVAKQHEGWDAALSLVLAFDRDHRALLERLLRRWARMGSRYLDDWDELTTALSDADSLAEDVEAAREERRTRQGYVEPRAARAFLNLTRTPAPGGERDPLTRAYFRDGQRVGRDGSFTAALQDDAWGALPPAVRAALGAETAQASRKVAAPRATLLGAFREALRELSQREPQLFEQRLEEVAYVSNVLVSGHEHRGERLRPKAAADAALATICYGASQHLARLGKALDATGLAGALRERGADLLFRDGRSALAAGSAPHLSDSAKEGLLYSADELEAAFAERYVAATSNSSELLGSRSPSVRSAK